MATRRSQRAPRWPQEGPRRPQNGPKRTQDGAKIAHHRSRESKLEPTGPNVKNIEKTLGKSMFLKGPGPTESSNLRPRWPHGGLKLG